MMSILGDKSPREMSISSPSPSPNDNTMHINNNSIGPSDQLVIRNDDRVNLINSIERVNQINPLLDNHHPLSHLDQYRIQLYNYAIQAERIRLSQQYAQTYASGAYQTPNTNRVVNYFHPRFQINNEEPKPQHSYIGLIAMAILSNPDMKLVLSDIYQYILDNYTYFRSRGPGWRNSIRHNLSLNDCFIKAGRSANGKGHYWSIHPANIEDFKKGDFRRRKAQRKVRKHMGLSVDDDNDSNSPPPPHSPPLNFTNFIYPFQYFPQTIIFPSIATQCVSRKRQFDVDSLLAPDQPKHEFETPKKLKSSLDSDELRTTNEMRDFRDNIEFNSLRRLNELSNITSDNDTRTIHELKRNKELNEMMRHRHNILNDGQISECINETREHNDINDNDTRHINETSSTSRCDESSDSRRYTTINENNIKLFNNRNDTIKEEFIDLRDNDNQIIEASDSRMNQFKFMNNNNQQLVTNEYVRDRKKSSDEEINLKWDIEQKSDKLLIEGSPRGRKTDERDRKNSNTSEDADVDGEYETDIDVVNNNKFKENLMLQKYYHSIALRRLEIYQQFQNSSRADP